MPQLECLGSSTLTLNDISYFASLSFSFLKCKSWDYNYTNFMELWVLNDVMFVKHSEQYYAHEKHSINGSCYYQSLISCHGREMSQHSRERVGQCSVGSRVEDLKMVRDKIYLLATRPALWHFNSLFTFPFFAGRINLNPDDVIYTTAICHYTS